MSVGKDSLKRAASATAAKETKTTAAAKTAGKKPVVKKAETKLENQSENKEVTVAVNTGTSKEVKDMFVPEERVSHVREELPVYLL